MLTVAQMLTLAASNSSGYTPEELGRIVAADILAERDERRIAEEYRQQRKDDDDAM